jgi:hypothetical protein
MIQYFRIVHNNDVYMECKNNRQEKEAPRNGELVITYDFLRMLERISQYD